MIASTNSWAAIPGMSRWSSCHKWRQKIAAPPSWISEDNTSMHTHSGYVRERRGKLYTKTLYFANTHAHQSQSPIWCPTISEGRQGARAFPSTPRSAASCVLDPAGAKHLRHVNKNMEWCVVMKHNKTVSITIPLYIFNYPWLCDEGAVLKTIAVHALGRGRSNTFSEKNKNNL